MTKIKNKRLYEEVLVKKLIAIAIINAIGKNVKQDEVNEFVKDQFDTIVQKLLRD